MQPFDAAFGGPHGPWLPLPRTAPDTWLYFNVSTPSQQLILVGLNIVAYTLYAVVVTDYRDRSGIKPNTRQLSASI